MVEKAVINPHSLHKYKPKVTCACACLVTAALRYDPFPYRLQKARVSQMVEKLLELGARPPSTPELCSYCKESASTDDGYWGWLHLVINSDQTVGSECMQFSELNVISNQPLMVTNRFLKKLELCVLRSKKDEQMKNTYYSQPDRVDRPD